eukprot:Clim_evm13s207 gene=Clim_evmTU13s207
MVSAAQVIIYITLPFTAGVVGYITNVVAVKMTFYPIEFFGIGKPWGFFPFENCGLGWQGIVPNKAEKMVTIAMDLIRSELLDTKEIFARLDPKIVAQLARPELVKTVKNIIDQVADQEFPELWKRLEPQYKEEIYAVVADDVPNSLPVVMDELRENIDDVFDLTQMVVDETMKDKSKIVELFMTVGKKEVRFIERSGFYFGSVFGTIQTLIYIFLFVEFDYREGKYWFLPLCGFAVGYVTNYLALLFIFKPRRPTTYCGITLHGVFMKRQAAVAELYADQMTRELLDARTMFHHLMHGKKHKDLFALIHNRVNASFDEFEHKRFLTVAIGEERYTALGPMVADAIIRDLPNITEIIADYADKAMDVQNTLEDKLKNCTPEQYEALLHPAFEEDEWKLILIGGILGALVGVAQIFYIDLN